MADAGMPGHTFHHLRHTFAVEMLRAGVDVETISSVLGHRDPGFTLRVYADFTPDLRQNAALKLQEIMDRRAAVSIDLQITKVPGPLGATL